MIYQVIYACQEQVQGAQQASWWRELLLFHQKERTGARSKSNTAIRSLGNVCSNWPTGCPTWKIAPRIANEIQLFQVVEALEHLAKVYMAKIVPAIKTGSIR